MFQKYIYKKLKNFSKTYLCEILSNNLIREKKIKANSYELN